MYTQAMEGCHPVALDYANKMIEVNENAFKPPMQASREVIDLYLRQEKAVIFRLMGKWKEALEEFGHILDVEEDYDCLIQVSYLKRLMQDESGALDYARRARKILQGEEQLRSPSHRPFCLGLKYPDEHHKWILNVHD
jgi:tetratricopeptide (TPR) repeat protein